MLQLKRFLVFISTFFSIISPLFAAEFDAVTSRAAGMGGAGVALSQQALTPYWNPALLGIQTGGFDFQIEAGSAYYNHEDFIDQANLAIQSVQKAQETEDLQDIATAVFQVEALSGQFAIAKPNLSMGFRLSRYALYFTSFNNAAVGVSGTTVIPFVPGEYQANVSGIQLGEIGVSHGRSLFQKNLLLGLTIKVLGGVEILAQQPLRQLEDIQSYLQEEARDIQMDHVTFSFDLGLGYRLLQDRLTLGAIGKYLTAPTVSLGDGRNETIDPMVRLGLSYRVLSRLIASMDFDLTANASRFGFEQNSGDIARIHTRNLNVGAEVNVFNYRRLDIFFRSGFSADLGETSEDELITAGIGLRLWFIQMDVSAGINPYFNYERSGFLQGGVNIFF